MGRGGDLKAATESTTASALDPERDTFPKLVRDNARRLADKVAIREKDFGIWQAYTWSQYFEQARLIALGLASLGFARGDRGPGAGRRPGADLPGLHRARDGVHHRALRGAVRRRRGSGAGRQAPGR